MTRALISYPPGLYPWGSGWGEMNMILKDRARGSAMHLSSEREGYRSDTPAENPINWPRYCGVVSAWTKIFISVMTLIWTDMLRTKLLLAETSTTRTSL